MGRAKAYGHDRKVIITFLEKDFDLVGDLPVLVGFAPLFLSGRSAIQPLTKTLPIASLSQSLLAMRSHYYLLSLTGSLTETGSAELPALA